MTPDNKIINGLWGCREGETLSNLERLCIYSFCANGHDFRLWTYYDVDNVPTDTAPGKVIIGDAESVLPKSKMFFAKSDLATFSDWFRWELMRQIGGWWADMDMVALRPIDFADDVMLGKEAYGSINPAFMKFPKGHYFAEAIAGACANPNKIVPWDTRKRWLRKMLRRILFWQKSHSWLSRGEGGGPGACALAARHFGVFDVAKPAWISTYILFQHINFLFDEELHQAGLLQPILQNCYAMHFWSNILSKEGIDRNGQFPPNSPFEILKRRYLPELRETRRQEKP